MNTKFPIVKLGEILHLEADVEPIDSAKTYLMAGVYSFGRGLFARSPLDGTDTTYKYFHRLHKDDFVISQPKAWEGALARVPKEFDNWFLSPVFPTFRAKQEKLEIRYLEWYCRQSKVWDELRFKARGIGARRESVMPKQFLSLQIPLPPLSEQQRIVVKIEQLAAKIEEALELQKQTIDEANNFLPAARFEVFGSMSTEAIEVKKLDDIAPINMGQSPPGESYNEFGNGHPLLNGPTEFGEQHPTPIQWTTMPTKFCKPNDILLCVRGATTGRMNWADQEYCIGRGLAALSVNKDLCVPEYVYHFVETRTQEMLAMSAGSTFPNLPGTKLKTLTIPVPTISEQHRIVAYLDGLQAQVDRLKALQAQTAAELEALLPSILDQAFKGEL